MIERNEVFIIYPSIIEQTEQQLRAVYQTKSTIFIFMYSPLCGTCKLAARMLHVVTVMEPQLQIYGADANMMPALCQDWRISSIPCLIAVNGTNEIDKLYDMRSVDHLHQWLTKKRWIS